MSNYVDALRVNLQCPGCPERNDPGRPFQIELDLSTGEAFCNTCSWKWKPDLLTRSPK